MDNLRRFFLTASVIIFITLCIGGFITALNYDPKEVQLEPGNPTPLPAVGDVYDPEKYTLEDLYKDNVLFILTSDKGKNAVDFLITKYNPITQDMSFLIIPDDLKVVDHENGNRICTLGEYFGNHDGKSVADYLTSLLEIEIGGHCVFTYNTLSSFIKELGTFKCSLPYDIEYISTDADSVSYSTGINYSAGSIALSGDSAINLIKFIEDDYAALNSDIVKYYDDRNAIEIHSAMSDDFVYCILQGFVDKLTAENESKLTESFSYFTDSYDTSITESMLEGMLYNITLTNQESIKFYKLSVDTQYNQKFFSLYNQKIINLKTQEEASGTEVLSASFS